MRASSRWGSAVVAAVAAAGVVVVGSASADSGPAHPVDVVKELDFSCVYPVIGARQVPVRISATFPSAVAVGEPIRTTGFRVSVPLDDDTRWALQIVQAATVEGGAEAAVELSVNGVPLGVTLPGLTFPATPVSREAPVSLEVTGTVPTMTPRVAGAVAVAAGEVVHTTITPRKADGTATALGTFAMPCTVLPGQDLAMTTVEVR